MNKPDPAALRENFTAADAKGRFVRPGKMLIDARDINQRVSRMGVEISEYYAETGNDTELMIVAIMTGSVVFLADLIRAITLPVKMGVMIMTNYPGKSTTPSPDGPELTYDLDADITNKDVLVVDDILDTGQTLSKVVRILESREPKSVKTCVLLEKQFNKGKRIDADFVGFEVPDKFVVGYGLDYDDLFRNFPGIAVLETC